ncbi:MAG: alpha/beta hydrolase family protein [Maioricimonas sp. JB049]
MKHLVAVSLLFVMTATAPAAPPLDFAADQLPDTSPLRVQEPLDVLMVRGINRFAERATDASREQRATHWQRDTSSIDDYVKSIAGKREQFRSIIGAVDARVPDVLVGWPSLTLAPVAPAGREEPAQAFAVRWRVFAGVHGEGLLLVPPASVPLRGLIVAVPDADCTPEEFCGLNEGGRNEDRDRLPLPVSLCNSGCLVLVPALISREDEFSGHPDIRYTNMPHREFIYRMAFEMGRHIIGYEVQKILAAVDGFAQLRGEHRIPIGVWGVGEGGLLALHAGALDQRIDVTAVSGYFNERENVWQEPIYRNVWSQLTAFGDAEIVSLVAPRGLLIEASAAPEVDGPPPGRQGRAPYAAPGRIVTPELDAVQREYERAAVHFAAIDREDRLQLVVSGETGQGPSGSDSGIDAFRNLLPAGAKSVALRSPAPVEAESTSRTAHGVEWSLAFSYPEQRQRRLVRELDTFTQRLMQRSDKVRAKLWNQADRSSVEAWQQSAAHYRDLVHNELIGRLPPFEAAPSPRSRKVIDEPTHVGYEVTLDVYPQEGGALDQGVFAGGILLIPRDLEEGERRPVVVCQHGLEGVPMDTMTTDETTRAFRAYKGFATQLVQQGFIVYSPQNPYRGEHDFRVIQRKSNPMKRSLFSYIIEQHRQTLRWLASLPYVDRDRIGFYGLSYGGKTAVRVPPLLPPADSTAGGDPGYCLSICSADFNEWVRKNVSSEDRYSYVFTKEYEMFEWNMGHLANYAELSNLMAPRPFMVERGHHDGVAPDEWVGWEFAKVRRHYNLLGIGEKTEIEWFVGPHTINGAGTFDFLHRHLEWPAR